MPSNLIVGEFEQMVLLALLHLEDEGYAIALRRELQRLINRKVSRGALYRTLDRLEHKGMVQWEIEEHVPRRGGHPRRRFEVTARGLSALRASRRVLLRMWSGLEERLDESH